MSRTVWHLVCYDISSHPSRVRVHRLLLNEAVQLQKSVFLLRARQRYADELLRQAATLINHDTDDLRSYRISSPASLWLAGDTSVVDCSGTVVASARGFGRWVNGVLGNE